MRHEPTAPSAGTDPLRPIPLDPDGGPGNGAANGGPPAGRPRVYRLRLALIVAGLGVLAAVSTVFGMMMAVAQDLPALENRQEYRSARNSVLLDVNGQTIGVLTGQENRILVPPSGIALNMQHAVISIEDERFYEHNGIDPRGIGRALVADVTRRKAVQGGSTIPQQFVKNALATQSKRTVFEKLREAALAYHLTRKWSKRKILTEYLNSIYFGNGAYGVESAARTYFSFKHPGCGEEGQPNCASQLTVAESALLAGMIASPSAWDPVARRVASRQRRDTVLAKMLEQGYLTRAAYEQALAEPLPTAAEISPPRENSKAPYFTTWVKSQIVERFGATKAFSGGLRVRTTLDLELQQAAEEAVRTRFSNPNGPTASLVALDNRTGEVRAMVGGRPGRDYNDAPFNLATQGQRQPGSAFKAFTLAAALREGIGLYSSWESRRKLFDVPESADPNEKFVVNNYEGQYSGVTTLASATAESDNSVYAEVGLKVGTRRIARIAREMGIRTPISTNQAMTLGGLKQGVTPLDMAHAYETLAAGGYRVTGTLGASQDGPVGIREVYDPLRRRTIRNRPVRERVVSKKLTEQATEALKGVVRTGTGTSANTGGFVAGKTGTTENYGDAWFVGYNNRLTVAVWVGYPDSLKPMKYDFGGQPVTGGSFPAEIFRDFVQAADAILDGRLAERAEREGRQFTQPEGSSAGSSGEEGSAGSSGEGSTGGGETGGGETGGGGGESSGGGEGSGGGGGETGGGGGSSGGGGGGGGESGSGGGGGGGGGTGGTGAAGGTSAG